MVSTVTKFSLKIRKMTSRNGVAKTRVRVTPRVRVRVRVRVGVRVRVRVRIVVGIQM